MYELTDADMIWNRSCGDDLAVPPQRFSGALCAEENAANERPSVAGARVLAGGAE